MRADEGAVVSALINLLDNAMKYTPPDDKRVVLRVHRDDEGVAFHVQDNGIGIPRASIAASSGASIAWISGWPARPPASASA